jgi:hypothetical protein
MTRWVGPTASDSIRKYSQERFDRLSFVPSSAAKARRAQHDPTTPTATNAGIALRCETRLFSS